MPINVLFPWLLKYHIMPSDRLYGRNRAKTHQIIHDIIQSRKAARTEFACNEGDVLDMFLCDEIYKEDDIKLVNELRGLFLAGNETVNITTANLIYFLTTNKTIQEKLVAETIPVLAKCDGNFIDLLTLDDVELFEYTKRCAYESMRINPPAPSTFPSMFSKKTKIGEVEFTTDTSFFINIQAIHNDPKVWISPEVFNPDRFDPKSPMCKRPDGKPRSPLAFCAFSGGKRVCLGKTFAEIMLGYTIPLIYYHLDFEFINPDVQTKTKPFY